MGVNSPRLAGIIFPSSRRPRTKGGAWTKIFHLPLISPMNAFASNGISPRPEPAITCSSLDWVGVLSPVRLVSFWCIKKTALEPMGWVKRRRAAPGVWSAGRITTQFHKTALGRHSLCLRKACAGNAPAFHFPVEGLRPCSLVNRPLYGPQE